MKKLLLILSLSCAFFSAQAQTVLNEVYTIPNPGKHEFFELYYSGANPAGESVDCWTIITYYEDGANTGWYVMDLPNMNISPSDRYLVGASTNPFSVQSLTGQVPDFNWNAMPAGGSLTKWERSGAAYTSQAIPANFNDFFYRKSGGGANYIILVYVNGAFVNGFLGGSNSSALPAAIATMPNLPVTTNCGSFTANFSALGAMENVNQDAGSDNGFARTRDGKCGSWDKTSASVTHTPGASNGSAAGLTGSLTTSQIITCATVAGQSSVVVYNVSGFAGDVTLADDFPVEVQLVYDYGTIGTLDGADVPYPVTKFETTTAASASATDTFHVFPQNQPVILIYKTKRGCFDKVVALSNSCITLPVNFKSFTAERNRSVVNLKWETLFETNNVNGFAVQRKTGSGDFVTIATVASRAAGGNSNELLAYTYTDVNTLKGVSQYRIKQTDVDGRVRYTEIRSVRGEGQKGQIILFPNPSNDGKVNVIFEDMAGVRDIVISDANGRMVKQWKGVTSNSIQIENLAGGIYSLQVTLRGTNETSIEKFIVNKR